MEKGYSTVRDLNSIRHKESLEELLRTRNLDQSISSKMQTNRLGIHDLMYDKPTT